MIRQDNESKNQSLTKEELKDFAEEGSVLKNLPPHPNIVQFLGICVGQLTPNHEKHALDQPSEMDVDSNATEKREKERKRENARFQQLAIVTEFLAAGNLADHLRDRFKLPSNADSLPEGFEVSKMIELAKGIAAGMDHLHKNSIIHRDLAARNILIQVSFKNTPPTSGSENRNPSNNRDEVISVIRSQEVITPKISDFGLAVSGKKTRIPVRWSPPEMLQDCAIANEKTDIWSFGVVMYEISVACHLVPFWEVGKNTEVRSQVMSGLQLKLPSQIPMNLQSLVQACWSYTNQLRPTFSVVHQQLIESERSLLREEPLIRSHSENMNEAQSEELTRDVDQPVIYSFVARKSPNGVYEW